MADSFNNGRALVVGVASYRSVRALPGSVLDDARDVADLLRNENFCGYPTANVEVLLDAQASLNGLREALKRLAVATGPDDTVVIYFSGHGGRVETGADAGEYLIPFDCEAAKLATTALSSTELTGILRQIKSKRLVVMLDACHSAGAAGAKSLDPAEGVKGGLSAKALTELGHGTGRVVMASCRADEVSHVLLGKRNSVFTQHLLDALRGSVGGHDGLIRVFEVFHYVSDKVPAQQSDQHPVFKGDLENNFPLALRTGGKDAPPQYFEPEARNRPITLSGKVKLAVTARMVSRWDQLATYFEISLSDQATFKKGREPQRVLDWLEQRNRLGELRDAFNFLGWDDLIEELDRHPQ